MKVCLYCIEDTSESLFDFEKMIYLSNHHINPEKAHICT